MDNGECETSKFEKNMITLSCSLIIDIVKASNYFTPVIVSPLDQWYWLKFEI